MSRNHSGLRSVNLMLAIVCSYVALEGCTIAEQDNNLAILPTDPLCEAFPAERIAQMLPYDTYLHPEIEGTVSGDRFRYSINSNVLFGECTLYAEGDDGYSINITASGPSSWMVENCNGPRLELDSTEIGMIELS